MKTLNITALTCTMILSISNIYAGTAVDAPPPVKIDKSKYSPYPIQNFPNQVFFGDTHLHTAYSTDAGMIGNTLGPDEAYRFARGETVTSSTGVPARLSRPLDFLVIADHAGNLGLSLAIAESNPELLANEWGKMVHDEVKKGTIEGITVAYESWMAKMGARTDPLKELTGLTKTMWHRLTESAEKYNDPGQFTALIGYEWTAMPGGNNVHRNIIFRGNKENADQIIPFSAYDSEDPEDLWKWMEAYEKKTGDKVLAIPHNGNLSNGLMFDDVTFTEKKPLDLDYAERRARWEPLYEITQMKGDSEAHPFLSDEDEFADFETWDKASFGPEPKTKEMLPNEYAREALKRGLSYESKLGVNPFKFGVVGSTDSHTSLATTREDNYFGKITLLEPTADPIRFEEVIAGRPAPKGSQIYAREISASGLAAVWARENTREAIWDAMARKEVYATTGTRIRVRVFGGYDFKPEDLKRSDFAQNSYAKGVPMGSSLKIAPENKAPAFLIQALRDPDGANLDRVQIIKGWEDKEGKLHERVYDVTVSGERKIGEDGRCKEPVGNTVNIKEATYTNAIGKAVMGGYWKDPDFDPEEKAFYYVRVLEIPTPRWTTYDAKFFGVKLPTDVPATIQERAYTSPIWYSSKK